MRNYFEKCIDCNERTAGCHAHCDDYQRAKQEYMLEKMKIQDAATNDVEVARYKGATNAARLHRKKRAKR